MTLIPEPREVRTLRREGAPRGGTVFERIAREHEEASFTAGIVKSFEDLVAATERVAALFEEFRVAALAFTGSPRDRRRERKRLRLAAHYAAKLERIPAWKRS